MSRLRSTLERLRLAVRPPEHATIEVVLLPVQYDDTGRAIDRGVEIVLEDDVDEGEIEPCGA